MSTAVTVAATPQSVTWGYFDASLPPVATVPSGAEIVIETVTGEPPHIPKDPIYEILPEHPADP
jgi:acetamidase/formamidase